VANNGVRYSEAFRVAAVERMKSCETVVGLAKELGVDKRQLYRWRALLEQADSRQPAPATERESLLQAENAHLKRALGEMALDRHRSNFAPPKTPHAPRPLPLRETAPPQPSSAARAQTLRGKANSASDSPNRPL